MPEFLNDPILLASQIVSLSLKIETVDASEAQTADAVYCNVVFSDGSLLFNRTNFQLIPHGDGFFEFPGFFGRGSTHEFELPIPPAVQKRIADIVEIYIRKAGDNGWLLGSALLFANGIEQPVIGNSQINQFLDNDEHTLFIRDWSNRSLCGASSVPAKYPLLCPQYRIAGPVLGQLSSDTANILYRVEQEGRYKLRVSDALSNEVVGQGLVETLSPTATYAVRGLEPDTHYRFNFFHVRGDQDTPVPEGDGEFRTFPTEDSRVKFSFGFGSCSRNRDDPGQDVWTRIRGLAAAPSVDAATIEPPNNLRFFLHLGDTFYFYDDVSGEEPKNLETVLAANLSQRKHPSFLEMARVVPCCAVWDDHDFRLDGGESPDFTAKDKSLEGFLNYWGNNPLSQLVALPLGVCTLLSYGNVDIYLLDGRFHRHKSNGTCFGSAQLDTIIGLIDARPTITSMPDRLVILASGSTWNHTNHDGDAYGDSAYNGEREAFYSKLFERLGREIQGLVFLSGDIHFNEIYHIALKSAAGVAIGFAPEFVSSPLGNNSDLRETPNPIEGERKVSIPSKGENGRTGFAALEIDASSAQPEGNWRIRVRYYDSNAAIESSYLTRDYILRDGQFVPI